MALDCFLARMLVTWIVCKNLISWLRASPSSPATLVVGELVDRPLAAGLAMAPACRLSSTLVVKSTW